MKELITLSDKINVTNNITITKLPSNFNIPSYVEVYRNKSGRVVKAKMYIADYSIKNLSLTLNHEYGHLVWYELPRHMKNEYKRLINMTDEDDKNTGEDFATDYSFMTTNRKTYVHNEIIMKRMINLINWFRDNIYSNSNLELVSDPD